MPEPLTPDAEVRKTIDEVVGADGRLCWTCRSCISECPVNLATGRLQPLKVVRLANLGLLEELIRMPEVWYCLTCNRCDYVCPMRVKPAALIRFAREEAARGGRVPAGIRGRHLDLLLNFQKVRYRTADLILRGDDPSVVPSRWQEWLDADVSADRSTVGRKHRYTPVFGGKRDGADARSSACFTCSECSNACPAFGGREVFDPMSLFRMANLGMAETLLHSPSIWLCLACERCTETCGQLVEGHRVIRKLQDMAVEQGYVDAGFRFRWMEAGKLLYPLLLEEIDALFGFGGD